VQPGNGDRERLPQPIDRMKGNLVLTEAHAMKDVEIERAADQEQKANASDAAQIIVCGIQVAGSD
jgi:hypothetical protein